ncbi:MAG TPA: hypothetical protein VFJ16_13625 [Longimicrobium sp.]|nr:hypothetical protein [Longimicrobium sp.]
MTGARGVVQFEERWEGTPAVVRRRHRAMSDSLRRVLGAPVRASGEDGVVTWNRDGTELRTVLADEPSSRYLSPFTTLTLASAGYEAEVQRRAGSAAGERTVPAADDTLFSGAYVPVGGNGRNVVEVDTSRVLRLAPGMFRARMHEEWWWTLRMTNGMMYMREVRATELDCRRMRWRTVGAVRWFGEQRVEGTPRDAPRVPAAWTSPGAGTENHRILRSSCDALGAVRYSAAQIALGGLAWGTPPAQVRVRLEARGYRFRRVDDDGGHVFAGPGSGEARAAFDSAGLGQLELRWPGTPAAAQRRFRAVADSLTRALGPPARTAYEWELSWKGEAGVLIAQYGPPRRDGGGLAYAALLAQSDAYVAAERRRNAP